MRIDWDACSGAMQVTSGPGGESDSADNVPAGRGP